MTTTLCLRPQIAQIYNSDPAVLGLAVGLLVFAAVNQIPGIVADGEHRCAARLQRYPLHPGRLPVLLLDRGAGHGLDPGPDGLAGARHGATGFWIGYGLALWVSFSLYRLRMGRLHRLDAEAVRQRIRR